MNHKRFERIAGAVDDSFLALDKIENIDCVSCFMKRRTRKPVSTSLNELQLVKSGALFAPSLAFGNLFYLIDQIFPDPVRIAIPSNIDQPAVDMNGPW